MTSLLRPVRVVRSGRTVEFTGLWDHNPAIEEIREAQANAGFSPVGYGGPWVSSVTPVDEGWQVNWSCSGSCD